MEQCNIVSNMVQDRTQSNKESFCWCDKYRVELLKWDATREEKGEFHGFHFPRRL